MAAGTQGFTFDNQYDPVTRSLLQRPPGINTSLSGDTMLNGVPSPVNPTYSVNYDPTQPTLHQRLAPGTGQPGDPALGGKTGFETAPAPTTTTGPVDWSKPPALPAGQTGYGPDQISSFLSYYSTQPGVIASVGSNPAYWIKRIGETGGLNPQNVDYWVNLMKRPEGSSEGGTSTTGTGYVATPPPAGSYPTINAGVTGPDAGPLFDLLMKRAQQSETVNPNDPGIKSRTNAYSADQTRQMRNYLQDLAEKRGPNTAIGAETRLANETVGQNTSTFAANLVAQELQARRDEIEKALSGAAGLLTQEQQLKLQEELAQIGLQQQQYQFGESQRQNESQFGRNLAQNAFQFDTNSNFRGLGL